MIESGSEERVTLLEVGAGQHEKEIRQVGAVSAEHVVFARAGDEDGELLTVVRKEIHFGALVHDARNLSHDAVGGNDGHAHEETVVAAEIDAKPTREGVGHVTEHFGRDDLARGAGNGVDEPAQPFVFLLHFREVRHGERKTLVFFGEALVFVAQTRLGDEILRRREYGLSGPLEGAHHRSRHVGDGASEIVERTKASVDQNEKDGGEQKENEPQTGRQALSKERWRPVFFHRESRRNQPTAKAV